MKPAPAFIPVGYQPILEMGAQENPEFIPRYHTKQTYRAQKRAAQKRKNKRK